MSGYRNHGRWPDQENLRRLYRGGPQQVERSVRDGVIGRKRAQSERVFLLGLRRRRRLFLGGIQVLFGDSAHHFRWRDAVFQNRFAAGIVVVRNREDQRRAVVQCNQLLLGGEAERALPNHISAMVCADGGSQNFGGSRGGGVNQDGNGVLPNNLLGLSRNNLCGDRLAAQRSQRAGRNEQTNGRTPLGDLTTPPFPHIPYALAY